MRVLINAKVRIDLDENITELSEEEMKVIKEEFYKLFQKSEFIPRIKSIEFDQEYEEY